MITPFVAGTFDLTYEPMYGIQTGSIYLMFDPCLPRCPVCHSGGLRYRTKNIDLDDLSDLLFKYSQRDAKLLEIRGGEPTHYISILESMFEYLKELFPIRFVTAGTRPSVIPILKEASEGFVVDVRFPFSKKVRRVCVPTVGEAQNELEYIKMIRKTLALVKDMPLSYLTSNRYSALSANEVDILKGLSTEFRIPLIIKEEYILC